MPTISTAGLVEAGWITNNDNTAAAAGLPVDLSTSTWRTVYRVVAGPAQPGDVFRVHGEFSVTNDVGRDDNGTVIGQRYTVGVGSHLWYYDVDYSGPIPLNDRMIRVGDSEGENVTVDLHHLPTDLTRWLKVPATWVPGNRIAFAVRADAHSTAWQRNGGGDILTVDRQGLIEVARWTAPPPPGVDRVDDLEQQLGNAQTALASLAARVAALETGQGACP